MKYATEWFLSMWQTHWQHTNSLSALCMNDLHSPYLLLRKFKIFRRYQNKYIIKLNKTKQNLFCKQKAQKLAADYDSGNKGCRLHVRANVN